MAHYETVIANGTVVSADTVYCADVAIAGEKIVAVGEGLDGTRVIDATGCFVLPGAVDAHVHLQMPVSSGFESSDDFESGTIAAAIGGTTTVIDFVEPRAEQGLLDALAIRRSQAEGRVAIDYGLHMTIPSWHACRPDQRDQIKTVVESGIPTFKLYMAYQGLRLDDAQLYSVLKRLSAAQGALPIIHCENGLVCDELRKEALSLGHYSPVYHGLTRPALQEAEAVGRAMDIAGLADSPLYIVHVSCAEAMERISAAQRRGQRVFAETCPQYLALTAQVLEQPGGERFVCAPPPRGPEDHSALWRALSSGDIQVLATDHCPFTLSEKAAGSDFTEVPGGLPGVEARLALIYTLGVVTGRLSLSQWVDRCCSGPARMHGLRTKGQIAPGFDADLVIFDPNRDVVLTADTLHERVDWTPYEGLRLQGWPKTTICCGRVVVQDGMFVAEPGRGRFVARQLSQ